MRGLFALSAALWFALPVAVALADLRLDVRTDRQSLGLEDTLTLQITVQSQGTGSPRVEMPELDGFEIMSRQVQQPMQFSFNFGNRATVQSSTIYSFVLQPTRPGALMIKPVRAELDGVVKTSRAIPITVSAGSAAQAPNANPSDPTADQNADPQASTPAPNAAGDNTAVDPVAFLRAVADKNEPYEGEQTTVTIYLYVRERLQSTPNVVTEPTLDGLWVQDLLPARGLPPGRQVVNGSVYTVYALRRFAAFPLRSGDITVGPMALEITSSTLFDLFAPTRARSANLNRASAPLTLHVKPLPAEGKPQGEVAVGRFKLSAKVDRVQAMTGDAVALTAVVSGEGNIRTVQLALPALKDVDALQPEVKDLVESPNDLVTGTREYRWLLVPRTPGRIVIPALALASFDPRAQRYEQLKTDPIELEVVGQALPAAPKAGAQANDETPEPKPERNEAHHWAPIRTQSRLERGYLRWAEQAWYGWALLMPPLLWLTSIGVDGARKRRRARAQTGQGRVLREAEERREAAERAARAGEATRFYTDASAALLSLLEARLGESMVGLTRAQLRERLDASGMPHELTDDVTRTLEDFEFARFGSTAVDGDRLASQSQAVVALWKRLHAFVPRAGGQAA